MPKNSERKSIPNISTPIWNSQQKTQIKQLEQIQRNAAQFVLNKPYNYQSPSSVTTILQQLISQH